MKKTLIILILQLAIFSLLGQSAVIKETHLYSIKGTDSLYLDRYYTQDISTQETPKPSIIFMFGGGFFTGARDMSVYYPCFEDLAQRGYQIFSIDYRLGLKKADPSQIKGLSGFITLFENTVNMAVEDLYDATSYLVKNSEKWNIDPQAIVTFGSSAGAITVLQGEYYRSSNHTLAKRLPENFKYAGVMSMAGSLFAAGEKIKMNEAMAPVLLFHGTADVNVPYGVMKFFRNGFYGSEYLVKQAEKHDIPYYFCSFRYHDHHIAITPMYENRDDIQYFLTHFVQGKKQMQITKNIEDPAKPKAKERFGAMDYIRANFVQ